MEENKNTIILVLAIVLVGSLYFNFKLRSEIVSEREQLNIESSNDGLFKKKQECASYLSAIEKKLVELDTRSEKGTHSNVLNEIWFSPSMNTCLYSSFGYWETFKDKKIIYEYQIYDYFGNSLVESMMEVPGSVSRLDAFNTFNSRKDELKK